MSDKMDKAIAAGAQLEAAGEGPWPCSTMLFVIVLGGIAFVVLPVVLGMGG